jgi:iron(III) transport system permease protein
MLYFQRVGFLCGISIGAATLILLPILAVVGSMFGGADGNAADTWAHLMRTALGSYVLNTALLVAGVAAGVVSIGVCSAWLVTAYRFPGQRVLEWALMLPLAMPAYVMAYAYTDWLQFTGPVQESLRALTGWRAREYWFPEIRSLGGAALLLSFAFYPYVYLLARTAFLDTSRGALEAGRLAGLGAWGSFWRVALPIARPAIAAGTALALMETLADFGTVSYFALEVFTTGIFKAWLSMGDAVAAGQLSVCLLAFVALVLSLERASRGRARYASAQGRSPAAQPLAGWGALLASALCVLPVLLGFLLPAGLLLHLAWSDIGARADFSVGARLGSLLANSFILAGVAAAAGVALATAMAYAARLSSTRLVAAANRTAALGYAIPGAVIAVGILVPLGRLDNWLAGGLEAAFGVKPGLLLTGTIAALIYAYLVRFLAVALQTMEAGLAKVTPRMDDAARSLGATPAQALARVHAPLLASSLAGAALLLFVDVMKELPVTFALRPFNFDTLAIEAYNLAKDERLAEAAVPSLAIVAIGLLPLLVVTRRYFHATRS